MRVKREFKIRCSCKLEDELDVDLRTFEVCIIHKVTEVIKVDYTGLDDKEWFMKFYECSIDDEKFDDFVKFLKKKYERLNVTLLY